MTTERKSSSPDRTTTAALFTTGVVVIAVLAIVLAGGTGSATLHLEATDAQLVGGFIAVEDPQAPGGVFVHADRVGDTEVFNGEDGAIFCFEVHQPGDYSFSADVLGANNGARANSYFVGIDYLEPWVWEFPKSSGYQTEPVTGDHGEVAIHLEVGQHVVGFYHRKSGAHLAGVNVHGEPGMSEPQRCTGPAVAEAESDSDIGSDTATTSQGATVQTPSETDELTTSTSGSTATSAGDGTARPTTEPNATQPTTQSPTTTANNETSTTSARGDFDVVIAPTDDVNAVLQSNPEGTSFLLKAGTYRRLTLQPQSGQTITGEEGTVLDGEGATRNGVGGEDVYANNVTLRNLKIVNYTEWGIAWAAQGWGKDWVIAGCEVANNYAGVQMKGTGVTVQNSYIHHNTVHGLFGGAGSGGVVLEGNEIAYNHSKTHPGRTDGGILLVHASNSVIRNNHIHHNYAVGLHFDGKQKNVVIEGNVAEDNDDEGIVYELGFSATIRNNVVRRNGANTSSRAGQGAGILVFGATDVRIEGNRVEGNLNGIVGRQVDRTNPDTGKLWELRNLRVRNNTVTMENGFSGVHDTTSGQPSLNANNVFEGNKYNLSSPTGSFFRWGSNTMSLTDWQKIHPQDS
jgi:nitrous oxidase accessory protein NosD